MTADGILATPSPNFNARDNNAAIDMLILHYTGMRSAEAALERLCDPEAQVSAHYLIDEGGTVHRLVAEATRAWHAGVGSWRNNTDINGRSIGIELVNPGHEFGYRDFPEPQMQALIGLAKGILGRHPIPARNVVGHSDIAPDRKQDPGELFDWARMAGHGIGIWPDPDPAAGEDAMGMLAAYGYDISADHVVTAFQRHFQPHKLDGVIDDETRALLGGLLRAIA
ncbi:MAG: N-acetylmuramoyl-L-alanine amidase [Alphaproteobacteria bacterium]|nr:N-acetylmuramoyl-L-alanine amidase [Alphaproteobacteria bacterium]